MRESRGSAVVTVLNQDGDIRGCGFLAADGLICTCSHVVSDAVGLTRDAPERPRAAVNVRFPFFGVEVACEVDYWNPDEDVDIALLNLADSAPSGVTPVSLVPATGLSGVPFLVLGFPEARDEGRYSYGVVRDLLPSGWIQLEAEGVLGIRISPGFSGSPVLVEASGEFRAIGMLVAADTDPDVKTAFAVSTERLSEFDSRIRMGEPARPTQLDRYKSRLRDAVDRTFPVDETYVRLEARLSGDTIIDSTTLLDHLGGAERIVIAAPSGAGKSDLLGQLARHVLDGPDVPAVVDLKKWGPALSDQLLSCESVGEGLGQVLRVSVADLSFEALEEMAVDRSVVLMVDGLNEVRGEEAIQAIVQHLDEFIRARPDQRTAIVSDRTHSRVFSRSFRDWMQVELDPLEPEQVMQRLDADFGAGTYHTLSFASRELLRTPYFLKEVLATGDPTAASRTAVHRSFFQSRLGLTPADVGRLADVAFDAYLEYRSPSFSRDWFRNRVGEELFERLKDNAVFRDEESDPLQFEHQLKHDYLASVHVAASEEMWIPPDLDALTFESQSLDALVMVLEQLKTPQAGDEFLSRVYDWNYPATLFCLRHLPLSEGIAYYTLDTQTFLFAVTAEKLWDSMKHTRDRARRSLQQAGGPATPYVECADPAELLELVRLAPASEPWFDEWRAAFLLSSQPAYEDYIQSIAKGGPRVGWTVANSLRRFTLSSEQLTQLRTIFRSFEGDEIGRGTIRWRVVHALGATPDRDSIDLLLSALNDPDSWVQFGAVRSLVESSARTDDRELAHYTQAQLLDRIARFPVKVLDELALSSFCMLAPPSWGEDMMPLFEAALGLQKTEADMANWETRLADFKQFGLERQA